MALKFTQLAFLCKKLSCCTSSGQFLLSFVCLKLRYLAGTLAEEQQALLVWPHGNGISVCTTSDISVVNITHMNIYIKSGGWVGVFGLVRGVPLDPTHLDHVYSLGGKGTPGEAIRKGCLF